VELRDRLLNVVGRIGDIKSFGWTLFADQIDRRQELTQNIGAVMASVETLYKSGDIIRDELNAAAAGERDAVRHLMKHNAVAFA
jgi:hypothetical protein